MSWLWLWRDGWSREWVECTDLAALQILLLNTAANLFEVRYCLNNRYFCVISLITHLQNVVKLILVLWYFCLIGCSPCPLICFTDPLVTRGSVSRSSPKYQLANKSANLLFYFLHRPSACISSWSVCSVHASVPESYAQYTHQFVTRMLRVRISSWLVCSG
jgi:hypothetical protein